MTNHIPVIIEPERLKAAKWLKLLALFIFILVVWGSMVRVTQSGLSIPDWPLINGSLMPPTSDAKWEAVLDDYRQEAVRVGDPVLAPNVPLSKFKQMFWIEYLHRTLVALFSIGFVILLFYSFSKESIRSRVWGHLINLVFLLILQAVLGGIVVKSGLHGIMIAIHLIVAYLFFGGLYWTALVLTREKYNYPGSTSVRTSGLLLTIVVISAFGLQLWFGGLMAGGGAGRIISTWPLIFDKWIPEGAKLFSAQYGNPINNFLLNQILIQFSHRWFAFIFLGGFIGLWFELKNVTMHSRTSHALKMAGILILVQIVLGITNILLGVPKIITLLHSANAMAIFTMLIMVLHDVFIGVVKRVR